MIVHTGQKGVAALDAVNKAISHQEFEGAINRDRRRSGHDASQIINDFIGPERLMAHQKGLQHPSADWCELLSSRRTLLFRMRHRIGRTAPMIMIRSWKSGLQWHGNAFFIAAMLRNITFNINGLYHACIVERLGQHYFYCIAP